MTEYIYIQGDISMNVHMELWMDESTMACLVSTTNVTNHIHKTTTTKTCTVEAGHDDSAASLEKEKKEKDRVQLKPQCQQRQQCLAMI
jgi:hypothetical protein